MAVTEETYKRLALEDDEETWELVCGRLRKKPHMTHEHADIAFELAFRLRLQLDPREFRVHMGNTRTRVVDRNWFVPDIAVVPYALFEPHRRMDDELEFYDEPLPLVIEVWSRSTGDYDVTTKVPEYQRRGDREIWLVQPYQQTLIAWRRQAEGSYLETSYSEGKVSVAALPPVVIDLSELFNRA